MRIGRNIPHLPKPVKTVLAVKHCRVWPAYLPSSPQPISIAWEAFSGSGEGLERQILDLSAQSLFAFSFARRSADLRLGETKQQDAHSPGHADHVSARVGVVVDGGLRCRVRRARDPARPSLDLFSRLVALLIGDHFERTPGSRGLQAVQPTEGPSPQRSS